MSRNKVVRAIETVQYKLEVDTDVTVGHIDLLERITHNTSAKLNALNERALPIQAASQDMAAARADFALAQQHLDKLENYVGYVEALTGELDEWISEIEVKTRRLTQRKS